MREILNLAKFPFDNPGSQSWLALVEKCQVDLEKNGMFNLEGFVKPEALSKAVEELKPIIDTLAFVHKRRHNIYFKKEIPGLAADHPALTMTETINHTVCYDQIPNSIPAWIYEWPPFIVFLAAVMKKDALFPMRDSLARLNVMSYRDGDDPSRGHRAVRIGGRAEVARADAGVPGARRALRSGGHRRTAEGTSAPEIVDPSRMQWTLDCSMTMP